MSKLTIEGIEQIRKKKEKYQADLEKFLATKFDPFDIEQLKKLKKYIDEFEFTVHQMYLFQGMSVGVKIWLGSWVVGALFPIPTFVSYLLPTFLCLGVLGYLLQEFKTTDFYEQLEIMKKIYNWSLKEAVLYDEQEIDSSEIKRMIKLMLPLCSPEFMQLWLDNDKANTNTGLAAVLNTSKQVYSIFLSSPSKSPSPSPSSEPDFKKMIKDKCSISTYDGFERSIRYFATSPYCRDLFKSKLQQPLEYVKGMLPGLITSNFYKTP